MTSRPFQRSRTIALAISIVLGCLQGAGEGAPIPFDAGDAKASVEAAERRSASASSLKIATFCAVCRVSWSELSLWCFVGWRCVCRLYIGGAQAASPAAAQVHPTRPLTTRSWQRVARPPQDSSSGSVCCFCAGSARGDVCDLRSGGPAQNGSARHCLPAASSSHGLYPPLSFRAPCRCLCLISLVSLRVSGDVSAVRTPRSLRYPSPRVPPNCSLRAGFPSSRAVASSFAVTWLAHVALRGSRCIRIHLVHIVLLFARLRQTLTARCFLSKQATARASSATTGGRAPSAAPMWTRSRSE